MRGDKLDQRLLATSELNCPRPVPLGRSETEAVNQLIKEIRPEQRGLSPIDAIGLELKCALIAIGGGLGATEADNSFWLRKCRELALRPAIEPLILANWSRLQRFDMTEPQMAAFCSLISGLKQAARTRDSYGLWEGSDVCFESAEQARSWWLDIQVVAHSSEFKSLLPIYTYARTIIAHPFPDGNGRLARTLLTASLAREADLSSPVLPLAPAFYKNGAKVAEAICSLSRDGDWNKMSLTIIEVLRDALAFSELVLAARRRRP